MNVLISHASWPDGVDTTAIVVFLALSVLLPALGHYFMVIDFRAYLRALRGALIKVAYYFPELPLWARYETPGCLRALGLSVPCTEADVKRAYHRLAEKLHPDRGGDTRRFLLLQEQSEEALQYVREHEPVFRATRP
jgi:hypothetical protein